VNATEVGSLVNSLGPVADSSAKNLKGGTGGAESTPLYSSLIDGGPISGSSKYLCDNGKPPAGGSASQAVCPEEKPGQGNGIANYIHQVLNYPGLSTITALAKIWNGSVGKILSFAGNLLGFITSKFIAAYDAGCSVPQIDGVPPEPADVLTPG